MKNNFVVYTALFGDYDDLIEPKENYKGCDFVCFTDQESLKSDTWEIRLVKEQDLPPNMMNRQRKILPHLFLSEYDYSLYVDANIGITGDPCDLKEKYLNFYDMAIPDHFLRNDVFEEANVVLRSGRIRLLPTIMQMRKYYTEGYHSQNGLTENNIIFRRHTLEVKNIMLKWWEELNSFEKRDQLCLGYILWKSDGIKFTKINESSRIKDSIFIYYEHKLSPKRRYFVKAYNYLCRYIPFLCYRKFFLGR